MGGVGTRVYCGIKTPSMREIVVLRGHDPLPAGDYDDDHDGVISAREIFNCPVRVGRTSKNYDFEMIIKHLLILTCWCSGR